MTPTWARVIPWGFHQAHCWQGNALPPWLFLQGTTKVEHSYFIVCRHLQSVSNGQQTATRPSPSGWEVLPLSQRPNQSQRCSCALVTTGSAIRPSGAAAGRPRSVSRPKATPTKQQECLSGVLIRGVCSLVLPQVKSTSAVISSVIWTPNSHRPLSVLQPSTKTFPPRPGIFSYSPTLCPTIIRTGTVPVHLSPLQKGHMPGSSLQGSEHTQGHSYNNSSSSNSEEG